MSCNLLQGVVTQAKSPSTVPYFQNLASILPNCHNIGANLQKLSEMIAWRVPPLTKDNIEWVGPNVWLASCYRDHMCDNLRPFIATCIPQVGYCCASTPTEVPVYGSLLLNFLVWFLQRYKREQVPLPSVSQSGQSMLRLSFL